VRDLCGRLLLLETAEVIRRAALFVGIDSGPAHLANAVGTPGVLLLGQYRTFGRYMPFSGGYADGSRATVLHADGPAATLTVDEVFDAVMRRLRSPARPAVPAETLR
jgi:heptosyltransferase III